MGEITWVKTDWIAAFIAIVCVCWAYRSRRKKGRAEPVVEYPRLFSNVVPGTDTSHRVAGGRTGRYEIKRRGEPALVHEYDVAIIETFFLVLKLRGTVVYSILHTDVELKTIQPL